MHFKCLTIHSYYFGNPVLGFDKSTWTWTWKIVLTRGHKSTIRESRRRTRITWIPSGKLGEKERFLLSSLRLHNFIISFTSSYFVFIYMPHTVQAVAYIACVSQLRILLAQLGGYIPVQTRKIADILKRTRCRGSIDALTDWDECHLRCLFCL